MLNRVNFFANLRHYNETNLEKGDIWVSWSLEETVSLLVLTELLPVLD